MKHYYIQIQLKRQNIFSSFYIIHLFTICSSNWDFNTIWELAELSFSTIEKFFYEYWKNCLDKFPVNINSFRLSR